MTTRLIYGYGLALIASPSPKVNIDCEGASHAERKSHRRFVTRKRDVGLKLYNLKRRYGPMASETEQLECITEYTAMDACHKQ